MWEQNINFLVTKKERIARQTKTVYARNEKKTIIRNDKKERTGRN